MKFKALFLISGIALIAIIALHSFSPAAAAPPAIVESVERLEPWFAWPAEATLTAERSLSTARFCPLLSVGSRPPRHSR